MDGWNFGECLIFFYIMKKYKSHQERMRAGIRWRLLILINRAKIQVGRWVTQKIIKMARDADKRDQANIKL